MSAPSFIDLKMAKSSAKKSPKRAPAGGRDAVAARQKTKPVTKQKAAPAPKKVSTLVSSRVVKSSSANAKPSKAAPAGKKAAGAASRVGDGTGIPLGTGSDVYLLPFTSLKKSFEFRSGAAGLTAIVAYEELLSVLKGVLGSIPVDEEWYLKRYPDVATAVQKGKFVNAKNHFVECGYFEGRFPFAVAVDEKWYLKENPDVATAVREGIVESGAEHYYETGYLEGRRPKAF